MKKIIVIGSYNVGLTVLGPRIPKPGETVMGRQFEIGPGGKGSNQAIAARRLGGDVALIARVGDDIFGRQAVELFAQEKLDTQFLTVDRCARTGAGIIFVDDAGQNAIGVALGANMELGTADLERAAALFRAGDILLMQLECPLTLVREAARRAKHSGMTVILNPAPACPLDDEFLSLCDYLTPNESEAALISGVAVRDYASARQAASALRRRGAKSIIVTLGGKGAAVITEEGAAQIPPFKVKAIDTTGAGDAFNGALAYGLACEQSLKDALELASKAGAYCVSKVGVISGLPTAAELQKITWRR